MKYYVVNLIFKSGDVREFRVTTPPGHFYFYHEYVPHVIPMAKLITKEDLPDVDAGKVKTTKFERIREVTAGNWYHGTYREV